MCSRKRVFILGAGFSKPAGMPLSTELLPLLIKRIGDKEMREWLADLETRLTWLSGSRAGAPALSMNIEQVFHQANFDVETYRLRQHLVTVGRKDGPGTPWNLSESIAAWLSNLEDALCDVIATKDERADLQVVTRWAETVDPSDAVVTFNYDTLVERALRKVGQTWSHGTGRRNDRGVSVFKLHGSIDWIVAHRSDTIDKCDLLFEKENTNRRSDGNTGDVEDDFRLWRCRTRRQLKNWLTGRDLAMVATNGAPPTVGIAGLGAYKQLHRVPGLGRVWSEGMRALHKCDGAFVVGFSMSDFDAMAQMQFGEVARARHSEKRPLKVTVIDPWLNDETKRKFRRVFRTASFVKRKHQDVNWRDL